MLKNIPFYASLLEREEKPTIGMVLVYGAVEAHSFGEKGCIASNETIANECGLKENTVSKILSQLNKLGWIKVYLDENNHRKLITPLLTIQPPLTVQYTPPYSTVNIDNSNKNTVIDITNVIGETPIKQVSYGKPEINYLFLKWEEIVGYKISGQVAKNRQACSNLFKKYGSDGVEQLLRGVAKSQSDKYAPRISDFISLQAKYNDLIAWGKRSMGTVKVVSI